MSEKKMLLVICGLTVIFIAAFALFLTIFAQAGLFDAEAQVPRIVRYSYIRNKFAAYAEPDFFSERLGVFRPHLVRIYEERDDGWIRVTSNQAGGWVFLSATTRVLERPLGAFLDRQGVEAYYKLVGPGDVEVLAEEEGWILISNPDGMPLWVDLNFMPSVDELVHFFQSFPHQVSVFYKNLDTGFTFGHRDGVVYASASLNKTPHALYVYYLAENGMTDLSRTHVYTPDMYRGGTGVIRHMPFGTIFTKNELLVHSVRDSDNVAFHFLVRYFYNHPLTYYEFYRNLGGNTALVRNITGHQMTAAEAGFIMYHIFQYIQGDGRYAAELKNSLLNSDVPIIVSDYPVAQKYGRWDGNFHDKAIVFADSPYILVIMSRLDTDERGAFEEFAEISMFIQSFNNKYFRTQ